MKKTKENILHILLISAFILNFTAPAWAGEIYLSMAASVKDAVSELSDIFTEKNPHAVFKKNPGASGALAKQIENGAPADIFISANTDWMDYLEKKGLIDRKKVVIMAYNIGITGKGPYGRKRDRLHQSYPGNKPPQASRLLCLWMGR
ncbi:MAG: molybdate ABC transporter substrate-binding protein [Deltaproteobacteria bacterium]|nr:molybdate ABC transporter substrate-binding protein [Deltaproteobacteria bacterium]